MDKKASDTALAVAALRVVHQLIDGEPKLLDDPLSCVCWVKSLANIFKAIRRVIKAPFERRYVRVSSSAAASWIGHSQARKYCQREGLRGFFDVYLSGMAKKR